MKIISLILGAGLATRMGGTPKPIIKFKNKYFLEYIHDNLIQLSIDEIFLVTGHKHKQIQTKLKELDNLKFIFNKNYKSGMFSSIQTGLKHVNSIYDNNYYILLSLVDMPFIKYSTYQTLLNSKDINKISIPLYNNRRGHPILIFSSLIKYFLDAPKNYTGKKVINSLSDNINEIKVNDESVLKDFDYKKELDSLNSSIQVIS